MSSRIRHTIFNLRIVFIIFNSNFAVNPVFEIYLNLILDFIALLIIRVYIQLMLNDWC